ncbi:MAG: hypothetical protein CM15mP87_10060 [Candidatus Neomarinimicrobiota bacterium]|nr:MAG: hypothetical protein CM15mP87_10060 [Candidatus Neomarinimicrobiota bacterium]
MKLNFQGTEKPRIKEITARTGIHTGSVSLLEILAVIVNVAAENSLVIR